MPKLLVHPCSSKQRGPVTYYQHRCTVVCAVRIPIVGIPIVITTHPPFFSATRDLDPSSKCHPYPHSTTISSKSSQLARLADELSVVAKGGIDKKEEDSFKKQVKEKKKKSRFEDRLKEALMRGDTPDSEQLPQKNKVS